MLIVVNCSWLLWFFCYHVDDMIIKPVVYPNYISVLNQLMKTIGSPCVYK